MLVFAHRGFHDRTCTENTLEAFEKATMLGADGIELDLRVSKDGELMVIHDTNLHRVAGDAHRVSELTAEELARIPLRHGGSILTLNDVTAAIHAPTILDLEIKHRDVVEPLIRKLNTSAGLRERVVISSFHASALSRIKKELPDVRTLLLVLRWPLPLRGKKLWARIRQLSPWGVAFPLRILTSRRVAHVRAFAHVGAWDQRHSLREARKARRLGLDAAVVHRVQEAAGLDERSEAL